ncbi:hypothetical protein KKA95_02205 [Patescibacteria group bacterium]|nr:hypothetical protein [Patescibacteria group bacterium]
MELQKLGILVLALLAGATLIYVFIGGGDGLLFEAGEAGENIRDFVVNASPFADEIEIVPEIISEAHASTIIGLREAINHILQSNNKDCFMRYGGLPDLGHRATSIEFIYEDGITTMFVYGGTDGRHLIPELVTEFEEMIPCVIAGSDSVGENFFNKFIEEDQSITSGYFNPVDYVRIFGWEGEGWDAGFNCDDGNRIMTQREESSTGPNRYCDNFEDGGIFFSPDNRHICFIPTNSETNADQHGIENDYVGGTKSNSLSIQLNGNGLTRC